MWIMSTWKMSLKRQMQQIVIFDLFFSNTGAFSILAHHINSCQGDAWIKLRFISLE
jgi:hypothetical protein